MTVAELLRWGAEQLGPPRQGLPDPAREARWLLAAAGGVNESHLAAHPEQDVPAGQEATFRQWVKRRRAGEPAHYLTGLCPFWGRDFLVSPAVLIPRPETELVVTAALALNLPPRPRLLDVGTGSGCLAVTLAAERPDAAVTALDRCLSALRVAQANARRHQVRLFLLASDLTTAVAGPFDLLVANLPYLRDGDLPRLAPEVSHYEPRLALAGGVDGTDLLRRLLEELPRLLAPQGHALLEIGPGQEELLLPNCRTTKLEPQTLPDVAGLPRVLHVRLGERADAP